MVLIFYSLHCVTCHFRVISALLLLHIITIILNHFWDLDFYRKDFYDQAKATNEKSNIEIADYDWEDTKVEKQNTRKRLCYIPFPFVRIRYIHATFEHQFQLLLFSFCFFIFPIFAITFHSFFCFYRFFLKYLSVIMHSLVFCYLYNLANCRWCCRHCFYYYYYRLLATANESNARCTVGNAVNFRYSRLAWKEKEERKKIGFAGGGAFCSELAPVNWKEKKDYKLA